MSGALKAGDRVRVTAHNRLRGYQLGDKGAVMREIAAPGEARYYLAAMDKDAPAGSGAVFRFDEIEPDV